MNDLKTKFIYGLLFLSFGWACGEKKNSSTQVLEPIDFEMKSIDTTLGDCKSGFCHKLDIQYPQFKENEILDRWVGQLLYSTRFGSFDIDYISSNEAEKQILEYEKIQYEDGILLKEEMGKSSMSFYTHLNVLVEWDSLGFISLKSKNDFYTGGAHPNSSVLLFTLDKSEIANEMMLEQVIDSTRFDDFLKVLKVEFFKARNLDLEIPVNDQGFWFESGEVEPTENFCLTKAGIVFYYNNYEIAPYVVGATEVVLNWEQLGPVLKSDLKGKLKI